jgi:tetratricopeptide (TPR) repeat protein
MPYDTEAARFAELLKEHDSKARADQLVNLSLEHFRAGRFEQSIDVAKQAVAIDPRSAEAYNNMAAAYNSLGRWSDGIEAAKKALTINPGFQVAKNNLAYAEAKLAGK